MGCGLPIAIGHALGIKNNIYCLISDGECAEGSIWESLAFIKNNKIKNIKIYVNMNGYSAYDNVNIKYLSKRLKTFLPSINIIKTNSNLSFCDKINSHYYIMNKVDYNNYEKRI